jgi:hypothetical protein
VKHTAKRLLERFTRGEISAEEFLRMANTLSHRELELLSELLRQRRIRSGQAKQMLTQIEPS